MKIITLCLLLWCAAVQAETYTEFYCNSAPGVGTNINAGSTTGNPVFTSVNGNWTSTTSTFVPTDGSTPASTVSAGMWAAVFIDNSTNIFQSGAGGYIAYVSNVTAGVNGPIVLSSVAFFGTAPTTSATARSIRVGGVWAGPWKSIPFPLNFISNQATNGTGIIPRINMKGGTDYSISSAISIANNGPVIIQGYTNAVGDWGKAKIVTTISGTSGVILTLNGTQWEVADLEVATNGTAVSAHGITFGANNCKAVRVLVHDIRGSGISATLGEVDDCEAYKCNLSNSAGFGGITGGAAGTLIRNCYSHDNNAGANACGFVGGQMFANCISVNNSGYGIWANLAFATQIVGCDVYSNRLSGLNLSAASQVPLEIRNCNFVQNDGMGITNSSTTRYYAASLFNCGFGSGTATNALGDIDSNALAFLTVSNKVTYPVNTTPWVAPTAGNFSINLTQAKGAGYSPFPSPTVAKPDIGAAQSSGVSGGAYTFSQ